MTLIVKIMSSENLPDDSPSKSFSLYTDVASIGFHRQTDTGKTSGDYCWARLYIVEKVKTALVQGFCENEKIVEIEGNVYVMNENGKTISSWSPSPPVASAPSMYPV